MLSCFLILTTSILIKPFEEKAFLQWMRTNHQFYTGEEYHFRLGIYLANSQIVQQHNKAHKNYKLSLNKFSTYTQAEFRTLLGELNPITKKHTKNVQSKRNWPTPPEELDWRVKGAVNEIVDQGDCGSCWAFGSIAGAEGCWFINKGELLKYSEQNLVDCVTYCFGCTGGSRDGAYLYVIEKQNGQFNLEIDYPYTATEEKCKFNKNKAVGGIRDYAISKKEDEDDLLAFIAHYGPTSVGIDASGSRFALYSSGIYDETSDCSPAGINHGVCCVGYGEENGIKYWIVRNSWGKVWGLDGYIKMIRGSNICGIASYAVSVYYDNE